MKPSRFRLLAAASLLLCATVALPASRPRYGGTLRLECVSSLSSLDPAHDITFAADAGTRRHLAVLVFDRLVQLDRSGRPQPALAVSWERDADNRRWQFRLRRGVRLHDGSVLPARLVVSSLAAANPTWRVRLSGDDVAIESDTPMPNLPAELALPRNSIVARGADGALLGSGPFRIAEWQPSRRLLLAANDDYWGGRPFVDRVEIMAGRSLRDQALDLQLNRTDVTEVAPEQVRRAAQEGQRVVASSPAVLLALLFSDRASVQDARLRQAISLAVDRAAIQGTILQKQGDAAGDLLPQWVTGFSFLAPATADLPRARQVRAEAGTVPSLSLAYDWSDPLARAVAERLAVNVRDVGITLQPYGENLASRAPNADARIVRLQLPSPDAAVSLQVLAASLGRGDAVHASTSIEELFSADHVLGQEFRLVPLIYVPEAYGLGRRVRNWMQPREGGLPLADVWLETERP